MSEPSYEELQYELEQTKRKLKLRELGIEDPDAELPKPPAIKTCNHFHENGKLCRSAAVTDRDYCYFHLSIRGRRLKMARARARGERWHLELPPLEDLYAVQVALQQVLDAMADRHLDRHLGGLMLYGLQQAATNLRCPQEVWEQSSRFDDVERIKWPGFEHAHGLPEGFDVDTPPEVAFPPPAAEPTTLPGVSESPGEDLVAGNNIPLEPRSRRELKREMQKAKRANRALEAARRNDPARKKEAASAASKKDNVVNSVS